MVITLVIMVLLQLQQMPLKYIEITNIFSLTHQLAWLWLGVVLTSLRAPRPCLKEIKGTPPCPAWPCLANTKSPLSSQCTLRYWCKHRAGAT